MLALMAGLLVVAGSTAAVLVMQEQRKDFWEPQTETDAGMGAIKAAIIAYQQSNNNRLPCPASLSSSSGLEGCAATAPAGTTDVGTGNIIRIGALPTRTLGLPVTAGEDRWGNKLTYAVVKSHTDSYKFSTPVTAGITVATPAGDANNQAYVVISHGRDGKGATPAKATSVGIACTSSTGADQENCDNDESFSALGMHNDPGTNYFDDMVIYGEPDPTAQAANTSTLKIICWGWNPNGQLGDGTTTDRLTPVAVKLPAGITGFTSLESALRHTCAFANDGKAYCWGMNNTGRLGDGTTTTRLTPVAVANPAGAPVGFNFTSVIPAHSHTCGMGNDGRLYCWGGAGLGEVGNGSFSNTLIPTAVANPSGAPAGFNFTSYNTGQAHNCGIGNDGRAYCWGYNLNGALGDGTTSHRNRPVAVLNPSGAPAGFNFTSVDTGFWHTCGIGNDGKAYCWGRNDLGMLGNGTNTQSNIPVAVQNPAGALPGFNFTSLIAAGSHTCGMGNNGKVYCWGENNGRLGNGTLLNSSSPVEVLNPTGVPAGFSYTSVDAWWWHSCAKGNDGRTYCWGGNNFGQLLGDGSTTDSSTPVVLNPTGMEGRNFTSVKGGEKYACGLMRF
jgi:alpha-tubulin suppressor-like RCC1 family protein